MVYPVSYNDYTKKTPLLDRFIRYALIPTGSDPESQAAPSAARELDLARVLESELRALGAKDVTLSEKGVVTATIPASAGAEKAPVILLNSHMDTSPDTSCEGIHPQVAEAWNGDAIALDPENKIRLDPEVFPELRRHIGEDIICTDGRTLLGADDKAGVAAIMNAAEWFLTHPDDPHAEIRILFTPDEEIGRGTDSVDVPGLRASYGFTIDGGDVGGLESETFNAATARITFTGISVHPGSAKGKMVTVRTFDFGADRTMADAYQGVQSSKLGLRGIRSSLRNMPQMAVQICALMRAAAKGPLRVMFPMVTNIEDWDSAMQVVDYCRRKLAERGVEFEPDVPFGVMLSVPAACLTAEDFTAHGCRFFVIGTNDLTQYTHAVSRELAIAEHYYRPASPAMKKLVAMVVDAAREAGIPVAICGLAVGNAVNATQYLRLGLRSFSMSPQNLLTIKKALRDADAR